MSRWICPLQENIPYFFSPISSLFLVFFFFLNPFRDFPGGSVVKNPSANAGEMQVQSLRWEDPLEKEMASHSSILVWEIPWTEEPGRLQSVGSQRVEHNITHLLSKQQQPAFHRPDPSHLRSFFLREVHPHCPSISFYESTLWYLPVQSVRMCFVCLLFIYFFCWLWTCWRKNFSWSGFCPQSWPWYLEHYY